MPGLGEIDWQKFISTLQENGYDNVLSIEHEDPIWEGSERKLKMDFSWFEASFTICGLI